jgi:microcin C transport system ATP-binding protein
VVAGLSPAAARARARGLLEELDLTDPDAVLAARPHELSGGMAQRVGIALALSAEPRLVIADEPTAALDGASARRALAARARGRGCGVLLITHDPAAAGRIADRLTVVERGRIVEGARRWPRKAAVATPSLPRRMAAGRPLLRVEGLGVWIGRRHGPLGLGSTRRRLLADVDLELMPGETLAVMGPSGSGKSTLAAALVGLLQPQAGRILLDGRDLVEARRLSRAPVAGRELQLVPQDHAGSLDPCWRVEAIVAEPILAHGLAAGRPAALAIARSLLGDVGLEPPLATMRPAALSGGQLQRVALARALAARPRLLILDEPTSALDEATRDAILDLLATIRARSGLSLLVITHDELVARRLASRVLILAGGSLREAGTTAPPASRKDPVPA